GPSEDWGLSLGAAVAGVEEDLFQLVIVRQAINHSLLEVAADHRYSMHPLQSAMIRAKDPELEIPVLEAMTAWFSPRIADWKNRPDLRKEEDFVPELLLRLENSFTIPAQAAEVFACCW